MRKITNITDEPKQSFDLILDDNTVYKFALEYNDLVQSWTYSLENENFTVFGRKLVASPNILRQFKNIIPFGLFVESTDLLDPFNIKDFSTGRISIFILNETEVDELEDALYV